jgi:hypothetical protein
MRRYLIFSSFLAINACVAVQQQQVVVDKKYDVVVYRQVISGESIYSVNLASAYTKNRPPLSEQTAVYTKAIEIASGCQLIKDSIRWESIGILENAVMRAAVSC